MTIDLALGLSIQENQAMISTSGSSDHLKKYLFERNSGTLHPQQVLAELRITVNLDQVIFSLWLARWNPLRSQLWSKRGYIFDKHRQLHTKCTQ